MFKEIIKICLNPFILIYFKIKLNHFIHINKNFNRFLVLDIDNTLANTWKYLKTKNKKKISYSEIPLLVKTIEHIKKKYSNLPIVYISHRNILNYYETDIWIQKNIINKNNFLILVSKPGDKLFYLNSILQTHRVIYYDDLSYNHENGKVLFYEKMIEEIKKMDIVYYDYDFIKKLNS